MKLHFNFKGFKHDLEWLMEIVGESLRVKFSHWESVSWGCGRVKYVHEH